MNVLEKRVGERMRVERKSLQDEQMTLGRRRVALSKELERCLAGVAKLVTQLRNGKALTASQQDKLRKAEKRAGEITRELETNAAASMANAQVLTRLENGKELQRRVKTAQKLGEQPLHGVDAAEIVLLHAGKPMKVGEITRTLMETGVFKFTGKTPEQTISGYLSKATKKGDRFVRVAPATYDLKDRKKQVKSTA